jgi:hypothetical protein
VNRSTISQLVEEARIDLWIAKTFGSREPVDALVDEIEKVVALIDVLGDRLVSLDINPMVIDRDGAAITVDAELILSAGN